MRIPKLLVSVRNLQEAEAAIRGGADIIDLKEPARGSLGMADVSSITAVSEWIAANASHVACSAALGELSQWDAQAATPDSVPHAGLSYVKVGLANEGQGDSFRKRLSNLRQAVDAFVATNAAGPKWITVAYADHLVANSPAIDDVAAFAVDSESAGLLLDTYGKTGAALTEFVSVDDLSKLRQTLNDNGLLFAIAGQLQVSHIPTYRQSIQPDVVAVRSAACTDRDRTKSIDVSAVALLKASLEMASVA